MSCRAFRASDHHSRPLRYAGIPIAYWISGRQSNSEPRHVWPGILAFTYWNEAESLASNNLDEVIRCPNRACCDPGDYDASRGVGVSCLDGFNRSGWPALLRL